MKLSDLTKSILWVFIAINSLNALAQSISKPEVFFEEGKLRIKYAISNTNPVDVFDVKLDVLDASGEKLNARSLKGDAGKNIKGEGEKEIIWDIEADDIFISEEIRIAVIANVKKTQQFVGFGKAFTLSALWPGLGQSKIENGKPSWLMGFVGYGCIAGSVLLNNKGYSKYEDYKASFDQGDSETLLDESQSLKQKSKILAFSAVSVWTINLIWVSVKAGKQNDIAAKSKQSKLYIGSSYYPVIQRPVLSFGYRF
jgi:hypothetical protein